MVDLKLGVLCIEEEVALDTADALDKFEAEEVDFEESLDSEEILEVDTNLASLAIWSVLDEALGADVVL